MISRSRRVVSALALLAAILLPACGGEEGAPVSQDQVPVRDTTVPPVEREPFTAVDETGLEPLNLSVELPWTANRVSKDPADAAPAATLLSAGTLSTEAFDRAVFEFSRVAPFPGYRVQMVEDASELACSGGMEASAEEPLLAITLHPVHGDQEAAAARGVDPTDQPRFLQAGIACSEGDQVVWLARLADAGEVRVLELRDPRRLVVDLR